MSIEQDLMQRSDSRCELCSSNQQLSVYVVPPESSQHSDNCVLLCHHCLQQLHPDATLDIHHWRCLNDSMWSQVAAVQVLAWRQLTRLSEESWAQDLLAMLYLDEEQLKWAKASETPLSISSETEQSEATLDSNGTVLSAGDTVTLVKDLVVKGANFTAKRGTAVRNISLTSDPTQIEGRVNGTRIVLLSCFLKKSS